MKRRYSRLLFIELIYNMLCLNEGDDLNENNCLINVEDKLFFIESIQDMMEIEKYSESFFDELVNLLKFPVSLKINFLQSILYKALLLAATYEMKIHDKKLVIKEYLVLADFFDLNAKFIHGALDNTEVVIIKQ